MSPGEIARLICAAQSGGSKSPQSGCVETVLVFCDGRPAPRRRDDASVEARAVLDYCKRTPLNNIMQRKAANIASSGGFTWVAHYPVNCLFGKCDKNKFTEQSRRHQNGAEYAQTLHRICGCRSRCINPGKGAQHGVFNHALVAHMEYRRDRAKGYSIWQLFQSTKKEIKHQKKKKFEMHVYVKNERCGIYADTRPELEFWVFWLFLVLVIVVLLPDIFDDLMGSGVSISKPKEFRVRALLLNLRNGKLSE
ncbi:hypothetical protein B0H13DRAFT_1852381 [Mycena leptocephala]|nr:hypothetical protein B0H13DRAFT_1852381 [Mycena leptocephala]